MITIPMTVSTMDISVPMELGTEYHVFPEYNGPTEVVPNNNYQLLETANKVVREQILVHPIPSTYGRIVYSGGFLKIY